MIKTAVQLLTAAALAVCLVGCAPTPATPTETPATDVIEAASPVPTETPALTDAPAQTPDDAAGDAATELTALLGDVAAGYFPGTAGCSLTSARFAGELLDWSAAAKADAALIAETAGAFYAGLDAESAGLFAQRQLPDVYFAARELLGETAADLLETAGYTAHSLPWTAEDVSAAFAPLFSGIGAALPA